MTENESGVERALRTVLAERAAVVRPPEDLANRVIARRRRRGRRLAVVSVMVAMVLVAAGVPAGLRIWHRSAAHPAADDERQPSRTPHVRGSLAGDTELLDAAVRLARNENHVVDPTTLHVVLAEQYQGNVVVLVVGQRPRDQVVAWFWVARPAGQQRLAVVDSGSSNERSIPGSTAQQFSAAQGQQYLDPVHLLTFVRVGRTELGVVVFPAGSSATLAAGTRLARDCTAAAARIEALPTPDGVAVFPASRWVDRVQVRDAAGRVILDRPILDAGGTASSGLAAEPVSGQDAWRYVQETVRGTLRPQYRPLAESVFGGLPSIDAVGELPRDYFGIWVGPLPGHSTAALLAGTHYPSGAVMLVGMTHAPDGSGLEGFLSGCLPAGQLEHRVIAYRLPSLSWSKAGSRIQPLLVVGPANTARAEVVFSNGSVVPVPLTEGGGFLDRPGTVTEVRAYDAAGALIDHRPLGGGLIDILNSQFPR